MKKILLALLLMLVVGVRMWGVPALHRLLTARQSDGTTLSYYLYGDEHFSFRATADGVVVAPNAAGSLCYARVENNQLVASSMIAHNANLRGQVEQTFVKGGDALRLGEQKLGNLVQFRRAAALQQLSVKGAKAPRRIGASTSDGLGRKGYAADGCVSSIGDVTIPVIMVAFKDQKFQKTTTIEKMTRYYNEPGYSEDNYTVGSVKDYFESVSNGKFRPTFVVVDTVTLSKGYAYYGADSYTQGTDYNVLSMLIEAIEKAEDDGVDFSPYAVNGEIPLISFLYAGYGEATGTPRGDDPNTIWPHELSLSDLRDYYEDYNVTAGGYALNGYFVGNELNRDNSLMGMGVFCHEFGHALGLPDWYVTDYSYRGDSPFGMFSIMDSGCYYPGGLATAPVGYTAYEKSYLGWQTLPEIDATQTDSITLTDPADGDNNFAAVLRNPNNKNEYYIFENRRPSTWYPEDFSNGMMVEHITYSSNAWQSDNLNNTQSAKRAYVVTSDGSMLGSGNSYASFGDNSQLFGNGNNKMKEFTWFGNKTDKNRSIQNVTKNADGTISFHYNYGKVYPKNQEKYVKVTSTDDLADGDSVLIVCTEAEKAMSAYSSYAFKSVDVVLNDAGDTVYVDPSTWTFALKNVGDFAWQITRDDAWISGASSLLKYNSTTTGDKAIAKISFDDKGNAVIAFVGVKGHQIAYGTSTEKFNMKTNDVQSIQLFKRPSQKSETTAISGVVKTPTLAHPQYFTVDGRKVSKDYRGVVIVKEGSNTRKIVR
ncbi:MAG: M6 family metalloprotease domain-containing protein [Prevotellaceae bacterium]|nr:M6 family metalloprotease domain-containing protein [Prevotellaceae bacterium]